MYVAVMTTETTTPEAPPVEEYFPLPSPETACPATWQLEFIDGHIAVCMPIQTAPAEAAPQPEGVNVPTVIVGANVPTLGAPAAAPVAEVGVAQTLPMTGSGETIGIGLIAAVVLCAGITIRRVATR